MIQMMEQQVQERPGKEGEERTPREAPMQQKAGGEIQARPQQAPEQKNQQGRVAYPSIRFHPLALVFLC